MSGLQIARGLLLDADFAAGQTFAVLAKKGSGKSYTGRVMAEEFYASGIPFVVLDPTGAWWGLRTSADGKKPGLPVLIFGGKHGDLPLERTSGKVIADLLIDQRVPMVLDLSEFGSHAAERQFAHDFLERLYRRNEELLHIFCDEADLFAPQKPQPGDAALLGVMENIVRRGRIKGLTMTLITQRSAVLNKDVLTQIDVLVLLRLLSPQDRKAMLEWVRAHSSEEAQDEVMSSLASLAKGESWWWAPEIDLLKKVQVRKSRTYDSSPTPGRGERVEVRTMADVDLDAVRAQIADTIERAAADDPKALRVRVRELEKALAQSQQRIEHGYTGPEIQELNDQIAALQAERNLSQSELDDLAEIFGLDKDGPHGAVRDAVLALSDESMRVLLSPVIDLQGLVRPLVKQAEDVVTSVQQLRDRVEGVAERPQAIQRSAVDRVRVRPAAPRPPTQSSRPAVNQVAAVDADVNLGNGERSVLGVLAEYPEGRTHNELAFLAGYSAKASTLGVILAKLRRAGLVEPGQPIRATAAGLEAAGGVRERPTGQALLNEWLSHPRMGEGERRVLLALVEADDKLTNDELCERTGYSPTASTIGVILAKLRKLGLVEKGARRVAPEFREAIS